MEVIFMPPLKKGTYCFAIVGRSVGMSVGRSVCRSVDQVLSAQYLLTPSLDQYHICFWNISCISFKKYDHCLFSKNLVKCQGQSSSTHHSNVINKVKVYKKKARLQCSRSQILDFIEWFCYYKYMYSYETQKLLCSLFKSFF